MNAGPSFGRVLRAQGVLFGALYLACLAAFVAVSRGVDARFAALASGPYLGTVVLAQLRVLPAYGALALLATVLVAPAVAWRGAPRGPWRLGGLVLAVDGLLLVLSLAFAVRAGPGLLDVAARKLAPVLPWLDLYALRQWHVLDVMLALMTIWSLAALTWWVKTLGSWPRRALIVAALGAPAVAFTVQRPASPPPFHAGRPNVLIIAADSLRADRLGVHGATRPGLTPHLDAFARDAIDLRAHHVATASTLESWASTLTGLFPSTHGLRSMYPSRAEVEHVEHSPALLPARLAAEGYETIVSSDWVGNCFSLVDFGFTRNRAAQVQNFDALILEATILAHPVVPLFFTNGLGEWLVPGRTSLATAARPGVLVDRLFGEIDDASRAQKPFFGVLFVSPTHLPYNASHPYNVKYTDPAYRGPHRYQVEVSAHELITTGFAPTLPAATISHIRELYDGAVSEFDATVDAVLAELALRGLERSTIVIVTSDHGEDLYDPGSTLGHGTNFFGGDQSTRVPFLVRIPAGEGYLRGGTAVEAITRNVDVAPTITALLGLSPAPAAEGVDLGPLLRGEASDLRLPALAETCYLFFPKARAMVGLSAAEREQVVELSGAADTLTPDPTFHDNLVLRPEWRARVIAAKDTMVRTGRWKLIEIPGKSAPIRRLYDLTADPTQAHDLAGTGLEVETRLGALLQRARAGEAGALRCDAEGNP